MCPTAEYWVEKENVQDSTPRSERFELVKVEIPGDINVGLGNEHGTPFISEIVVKDAQVLAKLEQIRNLVGSDLVNFKSNSSGNVLVNRHAVRHLAFPLLNMRVK